MSDYADQSLSGGGTQGNATRVSLPPPLLDVPAAMESLFRQIEVLGKTVDVLHTRLDVVCISNKPETAKDQGNVVAPMRSPLATRLIEARDNIARMRTAIDLLLSRVQL